MELLWKGLISRMCFIFQLINFLLTAGFFKLRFLPSYQFLKDACQFWLKKDEVLCYQSSENKFSRNPWLTQHRSFKFCDFKWKKHIHIYSNPKSLQCNFFNPESPHHLCHHPIPVPEDLKPSKTQPTKYFHDSKSLGAKCSQCY